VYLITTELGNWPLLDVNPSSATEGLYRERKSVSQDSSWMCEQLRMNVLLIRLVSCGNKCLDSVRMVELGINSRRSPLLR
jgi:hypothetical protein